MVSAISFSPSLEKNEDIFFFFFLMKATTLKTIALGLICLVLKVMLSTKYSVVSVVQNTVHSEDYFFPNLSFYKINEKVP